MSELDRTIFALVQTILVFVAIGCFVAAGSEKDGSYAIAGSILIFTVAYTFPRAGTKGG